MPEHIFKLLDQYSLRARLMPALLTVLPAALGVAAWFPEKIALLGSLLAFVAVCGSVSFLSECLRDRGKKLEKELIKKWGGLPSTILLRHRDTHLNPETKARYHARLRKLLGKKQIPSLEYESEDPEKADRLYASCGDYLREQTRDPQKFGLLLSENIQYGTRRNLLGAKPIALWIGSPALFSSSCAAAATLHGGSSAEVPLACVLITFSCLVFWIFRVNREWVRTTAFTYAERLLASCDNLNPTPKTKKS